MTKEQRIKVIEKAIQSIKTGDELVICLALKHVLGLERFMEVYDIFPELEKHKPTKPYTSNPWFPINEDGKQSRLNILNKVLEEIKNQ